MIFMKLILCVGSRGDNQINAMSTWAFHFEEYDKVSLFGNSLYEES